MRMAEVNLMNIFIFFNCVFPSFTNPTETSVHLSDSHHNGFLLLQCHVTNGGCCKNVKRIEFKKKNDGVCDLTKCNGEFTIPQTRDDTKNYRCFCPGSDLNRAQLLVTETRSSDYGLWTCECTDSDTDQVCKSNSLEVSYASLKEDFAPEIDSKMGFGSIVGIVTVILIGILLIFVVIFIVIRCCLSPRVKVQRESLLTRICFGKELSEYNRNRQGQQGTNTELQNLASSSAGDTHDMSSILNELQQIVRKIPQTKNSANNPEWCICGKCKERETKNEQLCCREKSCLSFHHEFEARCFEGIDVTLSNDSEIQKERRTQAYKQYNKWGHGIIASERRFIIIPSCCVEKIRTKFPDPKGEYAGIPKEHIFGEVKNA